VKYRQRNGWEHRDVMRLAHPNLGGDANARFAVQNPKRKYNEEELAPMIQGFLKVQQATNPKEIVSLINTYKLPWEALPTEALNHKEVWEALLANLKPIALVRNLGKMSKLGLFDTNLNSNVKFVMDILSKDNIVKEKVHPMQFLIGGSIYKRGQGVKGQLTWTPNQKIVDRLNTAFFDAFAAVTPSNKNHLLALDVSGSMGMAMISNTFLDARTASAAMSLITMNTEPNTDTVGFAGRGGWGGRTTLESVKISPRMNIDEVARVMASIPFGSTDCSLPMLHATDNKISVETFVVYTDSETYQGNIHASQALKNYRQKMGINAKLVVVGMTATQFTIADPNDAGMLDVVGFDASAPAVIADFSR
jgi:60 kDa SS-A/Ro ribonucleoprotein